MAPVFAAWLHFPDRKGFVSGVIMSGFGFGVFIYNFVSQAIANPGNLNPQYFDHQSTPICTKLIYFYFTRTVADNVTSYSNII